MTDLIMTSNPPPRKRRSRRLRKKLHLGEFQELGFQIEAVLQQDLTEDAYYDLWAVFIDEVIDPRQLIMGGPFSGAYIAIAPGRVTCTEADREAVRQWFEARPEFSGVRVGSLEDNWYPPSD